MRTLVVKGPSAGNACEFASRRSYSMFAKATQSWLSEGYEALAGTATWAEPKNRGSQRTVWGKAHETASYV
jgi:hypothetical protein